jgi:hypothetical protein
MLPDGALQRTADLRTLASLAMVDSSATELWHSTAHGYRAMDDKVMQRWYVAVIVVRVRVGDAWADEHLIDHQVRLIRAPDPQAAYTRALALGATAEQSYRNGDGEVVRWEFAGLADLDEVQSPALDDGGEVYSWRVRGQPSDVVLPKEKLAVFWLAANHERPVRDLFD